MYKRVSRQKAKEMEDAIFKSDGREYQIAFYWEEDQEYWRAVDNTEGDSYAHYFDRKEDAISWLEISQMRVVPSLKRAKESFKRILETTTDESVRQEAETGLKAIRRVQKDMMRAWGVLGFIADDDAERVGLKLVDKEKVLCTRN